MLAGPVTPAIAGGGLSGGGFLSSLDPSKLLSGLFSGGGSGALAGIGQGAAAAGLAMTGMLGPVMELMEARQQAKQSRRITRGLRREAVPFLRELTGLTTVGGKGGVVGGAASPEIMAAQNLLASPRTYSESEIRSMQAARRLMNPRFRALSGAATGATLSRAMPMPSNLWETMVQPRMEAMGYNEAARRRAIAAANQWRNQRYMLGAKGFVK